MSRTTRAALALATAVVAAAAGTPTAAATGRSATPLSGSTTTSPPVHVAIDFADAATTPPAGYLLDDGEAYGVRTGPAQGSGLTYGWVGAGSHDPLSLVGNGRNRNAGAGSVHQPDARLASFVHLQLPAGSGGVATPGRWELAVPSGVYQVTVAVGDAGAYYDSSHWLAVEDQNAVAAFRPAATNRFATATREVVVTDGRLTLDPAGGTNTKLDYVTVDSVDGAALRPSVDAEATPNGAVGVDPTEAVVEDLRLPGGPVDEATLAGAVTLTNDATGAAVPVTVSTSGGGDTLHLDPTGPLAGSTRYRLSVTDAARDTAGDAFLPWSGVFTTAAAPPVAGGPVAFDRVPSGALPGSYTNATVGPDGRLYAATIDGHIDSYAIAADGTLSDPVVIDTVLTHAAAQGWAGPLANRSVIGLAFDPSSTAADPKLWITDNPAFVGAYDLPDFSDHLAYLSGPGLGTYTDVLSGLPRSVKDHETNSIAFGPDGALYVAQGANTAMGAPDTTWGNRAEHLLTAAVLRLDTAHLPATLPLDVTTTDAGGTYDPFAAGAPLTVYASGVRNAYDLVWHTNGHLYAPTNGSAANGNTPSVTTAPPAACATERVDAAAWTGPPVPALTPDPVAQTDFVYDVHPGRYYGHPDPARCEWVLDGGNPTAATDPFQVAGYPVGTLPDRDYDAADTYDAGLHASADGAVEYRGSAFGGVLAGKLLVVRYSAGDDIESFDVAAGGRLSNRTTGIPGLTGLSSPLALTEDVARGNLYVSETGTNALTLLRPHVGAVGPALTVTNPAGIPSDTRFVFNRIQKPRTDQLPANPQLVRDTATVRLTDSGTAPLHVTGLTVAGPWTVSGATLPATLAPGASLALTVTFTATGGDSNTGSLTVTSDGGTRVVSLAGFWQSVSEGGQEPSVHEIVGLLGWRTNVPTDLNQHGAVVAVGDEVLSPFWKRADTTRPVVVTQLAAFHNWPNPATFSLRSTTGSQLGSSGINGDSAQSLLPWATGSRTTIAGGSFSPSAATFALGVDGESSDDTRNNATTDHAHGCTGACGHHVRFFPVKDATGAVVADQWLMVMDYGGGANDDYNDNDFLVRNIAPANGAVPH